jgi:hypothetical protein
MQMFFQDSRGILQRHGIARERDHAAAKFHMQIMERRLTQNCSVVWNQRGTS